MRTVSVVDRLYTYNENSKLGQGAFGDVFLGKSQQTQEQVAIKVIKKRAMEKYGDDIIKAIGSEVNILQQLSQLNCTDPCPFVVKIYDCFETGNHIYIILEYCNDGDLQKLYDKRKKENNKLNEEECIKIIFQVTSALNYLAKHNITHRDIKPENIFIKDGVFKLGDFGFASQKNLFQTTLGTYPYMAPEFFTEQNYNLAVDIWAVGIMYHYILFNELYFIAQSQYEVSKKIIEKPYVIQKPHLISEYSQDFLKRCIDKNPQTRIKAQEAIDHPLFQNVKNLKEFQVLFKTQTQITSQSQEGVQNIRNGCLFLYELGENLEMLDYQNYKFEIFYLYKIGLIILLELGNTLCQKIPSKYLLNNVSQNDWQDFISSQEYKNFGNLLNHDREVLTEKFENYFQLLNNFIIQNFSQNSQQIQFIINDNLEQEIDSSVYYEQINDAFNVQFGQFQQISDKNSRDAKQTLTQALMLKIASKIQPVLKNNMINFNEFQNNKQNYSINELQQKMQQIQ